MSSVANEYSVFPTNFDPPKVAHNNATFQCLFRFRASSHEPDAHEMESGRNTENFLKEENLAGGGRRPLFSRARLRGRKIFPPIWAPPLPCVPFYRGMAMATTTGNTATTSFGPTCNSQVAQNTKTTYKTFPRLARALTTPQIGSSTCFGFLGRSPLNEH